MRQEAMFPVLRIRGRFPACERRNGDLAGLWGVCGEVVEVDAVVGAAACEEHFLRLASFGGGGRRDGETSEGGGVRVEEEGVGEVDGGVGGQGCEDAVEDAVVGAGDYLDVV